jgi:hypothetical protein
MVSEPDPIGVDYRKSRQARRLPAGAACAFCGETQICTLRTPRRSILEHHHAAGQANDETLIVVLCLNCHAKATAGQLDAGALPAGTAPSVVERQELALRSLGSFAELMAEACYRWGDQLAGVVNELDENLSGWRDLPGMR